MTAIPAKPRPTEAEIDYLCAAASEYFRAAGRAGRRGVDLCRRAPALRRRRERGAGGDARLRPEGRGRRRRAAGAQHLRRQDHHLPPARRGGAGEARAVSSGKLGKPWTATAPLPGGDFPVDGVRAAGRRAAARAARPARRRMRARLVRAYGTRARTIVDGVRSEADWGETFGADLTEREVRYLMEHEWAQTAEDVLWRRSKLGLRLSQAEARRLDDWMRAASAARRAAPAAWRAEARYDARAPPRDEAGAQRDAYRRRVAHLRARHAEHPARADALRQDQPDAADGRARRSRPRAASSSTART